MSSIYFGSLLLSLYENRQPVCCGCVMSGKGSVFFDDAGRVKALHDGVYFTDSHRPRQKGAVEQRNGLRRRYLPKGFDRARVSVLRLAEERLNHRPRKCLGSLTPYEVLFDVVPT